MHVSPQFQRRAQVEPPHADGQDLKKTEDKVDLAEAVEVSCPGLAMLKHQ